MTINVEWFVPPGRDATMACGIRGSIGVVAP